MTGFARVEGHDSDATWTWEIKSVNARNLDVRCRVPPGYDALDSEVRRRAPEHLKRGNITANLQVTRHAGAAMPRVNRDALAAIMAAMKELDGDFAPPRLDGLLRLPGVLETPEEDPDAAREREKLLAADLKRCLESLVAARLDEGARLKQILAGELDRISELTAEAAASPALQPEAMRARLTQQLSLLLGADTPLPEERIAQEVALLLTKADVREEIDRLNAHIQAARTLLDEGGPIGRRLDFLCQEFNRESNTLCSKSSDVALTRIGLALKATIEQMREQVQNVE
ncbi:MAG: YicC family protein [Rhodospirillaceae bacterium]|nr:YicC family protein [Rhodospirillaceae bacterium]